MRQRSTGIVGHNHCEVDECTLGAKCRICHFGDIDFCLLSLHIDCSAIGDIFSLHGLSFHINTVG